jgi:glucose dehydrogenase
MVTEGGVVFHASNRTLRGYSGDDGSELWAGELAAGAHATPMGYRHDDMDYVVVAAGDELAGGGGRGDHVIAFTVPSRLPSH